MPCPASPLPTSPQPGSSLHLVLLGFSGGCIIWVLVIGPTSCPELSGRTDSSSLQSQGRFFGDQPPHSPAFQVT